MNFNSIRSYKKVIFVLLSALVLGAVLTACPPDTNAKKPSNVVVPDVKKSTHLIVPDVETIETEKYQNKGYTSITFAGKKLKKIGRNAFKGNKIEKLDLPQQLTHIEEGAFEDNNIETLVLPKLLKKLGKNAFKGNKLREVTLHAKIAEFDKGAFTNKKSVSHLLPTFKVPTQAVLEWIVPKLTEDATDGTKITLNIKTSDKKLLTEEAIKDYIDKVKKGADEDGDGVDDEDGDGADDEDGDGADDEDGDGADDEDDVYDEGDTEVSKIESLKGGISFRYTRNKKTGAVTYRTGKPVGSLKTLTEGEEALYFLTNVNAQRAKSYHLYKKDDSIRIRLTFTKKVSIDKTEVEKFKKKSGSPCDGKPYLELTLLDFDIEDDKRQACLTSESSSPQIFLDFWYTVKDGDNVVHKGISVFRSIKQHRSIKDTEGKNVKSDIEYKADPDIRTLKDLRKIIIETDKKPKVPPIEFRVRICKKDDKDECSDDKTFGINENIEVRVIFNAPEVQELPFFSADPKEANNPSFTLYVGDNPIKAYYTGQIIPKDAYGEYGETKKVIMTFETSLKTGGTNPQGDISIKKDSFQLNGATIKDIANRPINTKFIEERTTRYKIAR